MIWTAVESKSTPLPSPNFMISVIWSCNHLLQFTRSRRLFRSARSKCLCMFVQTAQVAIVQMFVAVDSSNSFSSGYFDVWPTLAVAQYKAIYLVAMCVFLCKAICLAVCVKAAGVWWTSALIFFLFSHCIFTIFCSLHFSPPHLHFQWCSPLLCLITALGFSALLWLSALIAHIRLEAFSEEINTSQVIGEKIWECTLAQRYRSVFSCEKIGASWIYWRALNVGEKKIIWD